MTTARPLSPFAKIVEHLRNSTTEAMRHKENHCSKMNACNLSIHQREDERCGVDDDRIVELLWIENRFTGHVWFG
jgi:hypothetical protein